MAKKDETLVDDDSTAVVDDASQDETTEEEESTEEQTDDEAESNEEESNDEDVEEDDSDTETEEEETTFEKRFPRFKGETPEEYLKNLEEGYANSSQEAVRLARENKELKERALADVANADDDDAFPSPATQDPNLAWAAQEREKAWKQDWQDFAKLHPEVESDETLFADFDKKTGDMFKFIQETEGRMPTLGEAMKKTWAYMFPDEPGSNVISKEERIAMATKNAGAGTKTKGVVKDQPKPKYTDKQIETAKKFDATLRDKSRAEIEEILDKYKK